MQSLAKTLVRLITGGKHISSEVIQGFRQLTVMVEGSENGTYTAVQIERFGEELFLRIEASLRQYQDEVEQSVQMVDTQLITGNQFSNNVAGAKGETQRRQDDFRDSQGVIEWYWSGATARMDRKFEDDLKLLRNAGQFLERLRRDITSLSIWLESFLESVSRRRYKHGQQKYSNLSTQELVNTLGGYVTLGSDEIEKWRVMEQGRLARTLQLGGL